MTTATWESRAPAGHYRFWHVVRMEWIKLWSLRSTWWTLAITFAGAVGMAVVVGANTKNASGDLTNNALAGVIPGMLTIGVLGVLVMTGEYSSGAIRSTLAAVPNRRLLLTAKTAVYGASVLALGEAGAFLAFLAGGAALPAKVPPPSLGQPGVLRAVVLTGVGLCLIGLLGLGIGAIVRHTAAAIAVLVGGVFVAAQFIAMIARPVIGYLPISIVGSSLGAVKPQGDAQVHTLSPWTGLAALCVYAAVALGAGAWLLVRRDA
jgi:ABC-2 type transport system permease protein